MAPRGRKRGRRRPTPPRDPERELPTSSIGVALPHIDLPLTPESGVEDGALNVFAAGRQFDAGEKGPNRSVASGTGLLRELERVPGGEASASNRTHEIREVEPNRYLGIPGPHDHTLYTQPDNQKIRLLTDFTVCSDRGLDLEGQHIARVAESQTPFDYQSIKSPNDFIQQLRDDLEPKLSAFFGKYESYFLPWTVLHRVLSTGTVLQLLQHLNKASGGGMRRKDCDLRRLAESLAPPLSELGRGRGVNGQFRRTLATLILVGREAMIFAFVDAGLDDGSLLDIDFDGLEPAPATESTYKALFTGWKPKEVKDFKSLRWQLSPTFFSVKRMSETGKGTEGLPSDLSEQEGVTLAKRVRYRLRSTEEVLPFQPSQRPATSGGFADVRFFRLHEDQQNLPRFTVCARCFFFFNLYIYLFISCCFPFFSPFFLPFFLSFHFISFIANALIPAATRETQ